MNLSENIKIKICSVDSHDLYRKNPIAISYQTQIYKIKKGIYILCIYSDPMTDDCGAERAASADVLSLLSSPICLNKLKLVR